MEQGLKLSSYAQEAVPQRWVESQWWEDWGPDPLDPARGDNNSDNKLKQEEKGWNRKGKRLAKTEPVVVGKMSLGPIMRQRSHLMWKLDLNTNLSLSNCHQDITDENQLKLLQNGIVVMHHLRALFAYCAALQTSMLSEIYIGVDWWNLWYYKRNMNTSFLFFT